MTQLALLPTARPIRSEVSDELIARLADEHAAILLSMQVSGLADQQLADQLEIEYAQFSRIKSGHAHFPQRKLLTFMDVCGNEILMRFLVMRRGYGLHRLLSDVETENEQLRRKLADKDRELEIIQKFMRGIGR
jgi:hypothetical protein